VSRVVAGLHEPPSVLTGTLSQREQEVLGFLSQRAADKKTIRHVGNTERRVKEHVTSNLSKPGARSRAKLWLWQYAQPPLAGDAGNRYSTGGSGQAPSK
jgi:DNA-binding NarL/FixJ family response regulator